MNCQRCGRILKGDGDNSGSSKYQLCRKCNDLYGQKIKEFDEQFFGFSKITEGFKLVLEGLQDEFGLDINDPNFTETPQRCSRAYAEIFSGLDDTDNQVENIIHSQFPANTDEMVMSKNIHVFSMCPHHLLPVDYKVDVAYLPSDNVIGISKLTRLVEILAKRPVLQEQFTKDVTENLQKIDGCQGSACIVSGKHFCMAMRGVKQPEAPTITSSMLGKFRDDSSIKQEFQQCSLSSRQPH